MKTRRMWLSFKTICSQFCFLHVLSLASWAECKEPVTVTFELEQRIVTLREPVHVNFSVQNHTAEAVSFDLGFDKKEGFRLSIAQPDGSTTALPAYSRGGLGTSGLIEISPGTTYKQTILLDEIYVIKQVGEYTISAKLSSPIQTSSGIKVQPIGWEAMKLSVLKRDAARLSAICEKLAKTAIEGEHEAARSAAFDLRYVQDPVAIPALDGVLGKAKSPMKEDAVAGLVAIGNADAVGVLTSHLSDADAGLKLKIESALTQIRTGVKFEVND